MMRKFILLFPIFWGLFCPLLLFSADPKPPSQNSTSVNNREERKLGDIFLGVKVGGGLTNFMDHVGYSSKDTRTKEKGVYFYNLSFLAEFYLASYSAIVLDFGFHNIRFDRKSTWSNGSGASTSSSKPYEQWFNRITLGAKFLFWNIFYLQTGPSVLINYNSSFFESFIGIPPDVNDSPGISMQWQVGLGASAIVGYKENGDPLMSIDAGFFVYIPVTGSIIDNHNSINAGGSSLHIEENPYQFEFSLAFTFLV